MTHSAQVSISALKAANVCAATEKLHYYLRGVYLTVEPRHSLYVATDGHVMFVHREDVPEGADSNTLLGAWIVPSDAITKLKAKKSRFANNTTAILTMDGEGRLLFTATDGELLAGAKPVDGTFPNWRRVIPGAVAKDAKVERVHFNPLLLAQFAKAGAFLDYDAKSIFVHTTDANSPAPVTYGADRQTFGVVMPIRVGETLGTWFGLPAWASNTPTPARMAAE